MSRQGNGSLSFTVRSKIAVQHEDVGPQTHGIMKETNGTDDQGQSYIIRLMKTGRLITSKHEKPVQYTNNKRTGPLGRRKRFNKGLDS